MLVGNFLFGGFKRVRFVCFLGVKSERGRP